MLIAKMVSGGQTGVDRGALEAVVELGFPYGGLVPKGRRAEDGVVPETFDRMVLNVAGPRESKYPGIQQATRTFVKKRIEKPVGRDGCSLTVGTERWKSNGRDARCPECDTSVCSPFGLRGRRRFTVALPRGTWASPDPVNPYEWRRSKRNRR